MADSVSCSELCIGTTVIRDRSTWDFPLFQLRCTDRMHVSMYHDLPTDEIRCSTCGKVWAPQLLKTPTNTGTFPE